MAVSCEQGAEASGFIKSGDFLHYVHADGMRLSLNCGQQRVYCSSRRWNMGVWSHGGIILTGKDRRIRRKS
jgi:hypothetical protein